MLILSFAQNLLTCSILTNIQSITEDIAIIKEGFLQGIILLRK